MTDTPAGENFPRAHLIVRHLGASHSNDANGAGGLPFVSIGAQKNRGHSSDIGALNSSTRPNTVKFKAKIFDFMEPDPVGSQTDGGLWFFLFAITEWGGKQRGIFINLKHLGDETDWSESMFDGSKFWWNWPIQESFYYPGVDWAYIDTEDFGGTYNWPYYAQRCLISSSDAPAMVSTGVDYQFELDLEELFRCASARGLFQSTMPQYTVLPIKGVHWGVEMNGEDGYIWAAVHDMQMQ